MRPCWYHLGQGNLTSGETMSKLFGLGSLTSEDYTTSPVSRRSLILLMAWVLPTPFFPQRKSLLWLSPYELTGQRPESGGKSIQ